MAGHHPQVTAQTADQGTLLSLFMEDGGAPPPLRAQGSGHLCRHSLAAQGTDVGLGSGSSLGPSQ